MQIRNDVRSKIFTTLFFFLIINAFFQKFYRRQYFTEVSAYLGEVSPGKQLLHFA